MKKKYCEIFKEINSLHEWKHVIIQLRGLYPTLDSEFLLLKLIEDVTNINIHMRKFKKYMIHMIYTQFV